MQLHGPAEAHVLGSDELHKGGLVLQDLMLGERLGGKSLGKDGVDLGLGCGHVHHVVERMVGGTAAELVGHVVALGDGGLHAGEIADLDTGDLSEVRAVVGELLAALDTQRRVGAHGRNDLGIEAVVGGDLLVPLKAVGRVVSGADHAHAALLDEVAAGKVGLGELGVGEVPDLLRGLAVEDALVAKVALELEVAPLKDGVAHATPEGLGPLLELLARIGVTGDIALLNAVGAHEAPLVVVAAEPDLGDGLKALVLPDLLRGDVAVVVDDRHVLGKVVEESLARGRAQQKVLVVHELLHARASLLRKSACSVLGERSLR